MAHQLSFNKQGQAEMFYYGDKPWHGLGTKVEGALTSAEAITAAGLDWEVEKVPAGFVNSDGLFTEVDGKFTMVRKDIQNGLGIVGTDYTPFQNKDAFRFFDAVVGEKAAMFHTAGALFGGRKVWLLAKIPQDIVVKGVDVSQNFLLLTHAHDGSQAVTTMFTSVRVVCQNTLTMALKSAAGAVSKMKHTANVGMRVNQVRDTLGMTTLIVARMQEYANALASKSINTDIVNDFFERMGLKVMEQDSAVSKTKKENIRERIMDKLGETNRAIPQIADTRWALLNAYTDFVDHDKSVKPSSTTDKWADSILFGGGAEAKQKALNALVLTL